MLYEVITLNDGSCIRLRPERPNRVWAYDFVADRTHEGKAYRMLTVIDEFTRECLAIVVSRNLNSHDVLYTLADLFIHLGIPAYIRSDNGPEFCARAVREWLASVITSYSIHYTKLYENGHAKL